MRATRVAPTSGNGLIKNLSGVENVAGVEEAFDVSAQFQVVFIHGEGEVRFFEDADSVFSGYFSPQRYRQPEKFIQRRGQGFTGGFFFQVSP